MRSISGWPQLGDCVVQVQQLPKAQIGWNGGALATNQALRTFALRISLSCFTLHCFLSKTHISWNGGALVATNQAKLSCLVTDNIALLFHKSLLATNFKEQ